MVAVSTRAASAVRRDAAPRIPAPARARRGPAAPAAGQRRRRAAVRSIPSPGATATARRPVPAPDELWFSSSTACAVSPRGWAAAGEALARLITPDAAARLPIDAWLDDIRARILALYGAPGCEAVLSASGSEAEFVALLFALTLARGPVVNIVVAPAETGSGVPAAASGRHFLGRASLGGPVGQGERLAGWGVARRSSSGPSRSATPTAGLRAQADVDQEAADQVERAVAGGAFAAAACARRLQDRPPGRQPRGRAARSWRAIPAECWSWSTPASCAARADSPRATLSGGWRSCSPARSSPAARRSAARCCCQPSWPTRSATARPAERGARRLFRGAGLARRRCGRPSPRPCAIRPTLALACAGRAALAEIEAYEAHRAGRARGAAGRLRPRRPRPGRRRSGPRAARCCRAAGRAGPDPDPPDRRRRRAGRLRGAAAAGRSPAPALPPGPAGGGRRAVGAADLRQHADDHRGGRRGFWRPWKPTSTWLFEAWAALRRRG